MESETVVLSHMPALRAQSCQEEHGRTSGVRATMTRTTGYRPTVRDHIADKHYQERRARELAQRAADAEHRRQYPELWEGIETDPTLIAVFGQTYRRKAG
jgi:hypothetical protein